MSAKLKAIIFKDKTFPFIIRYSDRSKPYPNIHSHYKLIEIHYVIKGSATYLVDDKLVDIKTNDLFIINKNEMHRMVKNNDEKGNLLRIGIYLQTSIFDGYSGFKENIAERLFGGNKNFQPLLTLEGSALGEADFLLRSMLKDYEKKDGYWKESVIAGLARLCVLVLRYSQVYKKKTGLSKESDIQEALSYIDRNFSEEIDLDTIAKKIGLTPNYLSSKFKRITGLHLKDYMIAKRINEAKKLLEKNPANKIISIAYDVGFNDLSHFNHTFKKITGFTPSAYRKIAEE